MPSATPLDAEPPGRLHDDDIFIAGVGWVSADAGWDATAGATVDAGWDELFNEFVPAEFRRLFTTEETPP